MKEATYVQIKFEESPVGDHQANGIIENGVNDIKNQFKAIKDGLGTIYGKIINGYHPAVPWLMKHAAGTINRRRIGHDGKTPFRRWTGNNFNRHVAYFGYIVWFLRAGSAGKHKCTNIWEDGIWLGIINESGEAVIGTDSGVIKVKDFRRKALQTERWNKDTFDNIKGTPWEPTPGRTCDVAINSKIYIPE